MVWTGSIVNIPTGWCLCEGTNGTPDLRNKFVVGAGSLHTVNKIGGSIDHDHDFTGDGHYHIAGPSGYIQVPGTIAGNSDPTAITGTTDKEDNLPVYFAKAFVMYKGF